MKAFVTTVVAVATAAVVMATAHAQEAPTPQKLFEAGQYQQTLEAIAALGADAPPDAVYLSGQCHLRLSQPDAARERFALLADGSADSTWQLVGQSAVALVQGNRDEAIAAAQRAVAAEPAQFHAQYQLGLALSAAEQWTRALSAFEQAATIDPAFAYAHYYAGLAASKVRRVDQMARHFEYFLRLAPDAPEKPAVTSLMRSVR